MTTSDSFGTYLRRRRKTLDLTQADLAQCAGVSASTIRKIESDSRKPSRQVAELLADCLEITGDERLAFLRAARAERSYELLPQLENLQAFPGALPLRSSLPAALTPFVGRAPELYQLTRLLLQPGCRLVTLLGSGGIGKTRLAVEIARRLLSDTQSLFTDGIFFVPLDIANTPELVPSAVADSLGFTFSGPENPRGQLLNYLREKELLLILDNVEHLLTAGDPGEERLSAACLIAEILAQADGVKILGTSAVRLNLRGEWIFELYGLPVPPLDQVDGLEEYSSVALFLNSARRLSPGFEFNDQNRLDILRICRSVEGMPLGIELAASWVRTLPLREIADEIEHNLAFLETTLRDVPERHRSMQAAFDHSWRMLSQAEQQAMQGLSVFQGGFRRQAAREIAAATLPMLSALVDKSLLTRCGDERYALHELVRQYAAAHLAKDPQAQEELQDRHAAYYLDLLHRYEVRLTGGRPKDALEELLAEGDNLRQAWSRAVDKRQIAVLRRAALPLMFFLDLHNLFCEGETLFGQAEEMARAEARRGGPDSSDFEVLLAEMQARRGWFDYRQGRIERALAGIQESIAILRRHPEKRALIDALWLAASTCRFSGEFDAASEYLQEGLTLAHETGDHYGQSVALERLAWLVQALEEGTEASKL